MKKTVSINLNGLVFYIDEDAYQRLRTYLDKIERWFSGKEGAKEIISDIENRIAELFEQRVKPGTGVVTKALVEEVVEIMGEPEEFEDASAEKTENTANISGSGYVPPKKLYRDIEDRVFGGICSGIAAYFNVDTVLVRVIFGILPFVSVGVIIPVYIVLWIALPPAVTTVQRLQMKGEPINISNIEKTIKDEYEDVKNRVGKIRDTDTYKKGKNFFRNMSKGDKTLLIVVLVLVAVALLFGHSNPIHIMSFNNMIPLEAMNFHYPGFHFHIPIALILILVLIALLVKPLFKVILYLIAILFIGGLLIKLIFWLFGVVTLIS